MTHALNTCSWRIFWDDSWVCLITHINLYSMTRLNFDKQFFPDDIFRSPKKACWFNKSLNHWQWLLLILPRSNFDFWKLVEFRSRGKKLDFVQVSEADSDKDLTFLGLRTRTWTESWLLSHMSAHLCHRKSDVEFYEISYGGCPS